MALTGPSFRRCWFGGYAPQFRPLAPNDESTECGRSGSAAVTCAVDRGKLVRVCYAPWPITAKETNDDLISPRPGDAEPRGLERRQDRWHEAPTHAKADLGSPFLSRSRKTTARPRHVWSRYQLVSLVVLADARSSFGHSVSRLGGHSLINNACWLK